MRHLEPMAASLSREKQMAREHATSEKVVQVGSKFGPEIAW